MYVVQLPPFQYFRGIPKGVAIQNQTYYYTTNKENSLITSNTYVYVDVYMLCLFIT